MKKVVGMLILVMLIIVVIAFESAKADIIVKDHPAYEVMDWLDEWAAANGYQEFVDRTGTLDKDNKFIGRGLVVNEDFVNQYGVDFNIETCEAILEDAFGPIDMDIRRVGYYENYEVFVMTAKTKDVPMGTARGNDGEIVEYYEGEMLFMIVEQY
jgi:hypothetical protein